MAKELQLIRDRAACCCLLPPPLWGMAGEEGLAAQWRSMRIASEPPPPTPPHKGEGRSEAGTLA